MIHRLRNEAGPIVFYETCISRCYFVLSCLFPRSGA
jgi:hypothetical protein